MNPFFAALAFLTKIPVPGQEKINEDALIKSSAYFPAVGMIMGGILLLSYNLLQYLFPFNPSITAVLLLALWVFLTGALHLDGLADTFDGIGGGITIEDRLRIMKDTHTGTFGMVAVILLLLLKYNFLFNLEGLKLAGALFFSPLLGRWAMVVLMYTTPYARKKESLGRPFIEKIGTNQLAVATVSTLAAGFLYPRFFFPFLLPLTVLSIAISRMFFLRKLGGITGDCLGTVNELIELAVLSCLALPFLPEIF
jgi:adenosylcobinamide-GDP ribazoletransferase